MVLRQGLGKAGWGWSSAWRARSFARLLRKMLFDISPTDPVVFWPGRDAAAARGPGCQLVAGAAGGEGGPGHRPARRMKKPERDFPQTIHHHVLIYQP